MASIAPGDPMTRKDTLIPANPALVVTCEHGGNKVPAPFRYLFRDCRPLLDSHRGFDPGALVMARAMAKKYGAPLKASTISRLLVDLNRSVGHRNLHMETIRRLPAAVRQEIVEHYYQPYRIEAEQLIAQEIARLGSVVHISCHSFTDVLDGVVRHTDIGLLYDPVRPGERALCAHWKSVLKASAPALEVRRNYPYQGRNDGFTTTLRKKFPSDVYVGIELELNQKHLSAPAGQWAPLREIILSSLEMALRGNKR
ncbi:N-formylglutamate amidohydrolase [uncultured Marinobacter sp.]|uniref:N-formylglutamate amidohydrolase n=1 Tax=uncultured Marinobacter sp. TaxID=187379 RepID=UPI0030D846E8